MVDGVAHHVHERIAQLVQDATIEIGVGSAQDEASVFASLPRHVAHQPLQRQEDRAGGQQADRDDLPANRTRHGAKLGGVLGQIADQLARALQDGLHLLL